MLSLIHRFQEALLSRGRALGSDDHTISTDSTNVSAGVPQTLTHLTRDDHNVVKAPYNSKPPINRIPVELLGEIFQHYLNEPRGPLRKFSISTLSVSESTKFDPFILGHVCSYWRGLVLAMPYLWSSMTIFRPNPSQIPLIRLWLDRAADCPLTLTLLQYPDPDTSERAATNEILSLFITRSNQWKSIEFVLRGAPYDELLTLSKGTTGLLESANLDLTGWGYDHVDRLWGSLHSSPSLRRVSWGAYHPDLTGAVDRVHTPLAQLTHIKMREAPTLTPEALLVILNSCQEVVELELSISLPMSSAIQAIPPVILPNLRVLKLVTRQHEPAILLNHITLPALTSLDVTRLSPSAPSISPCVTDLLRRSACRLQQISLSDMSSHEDDLVEYLVSPPAQSLQHITITGGHFTDRKIKLLTHLSGGGAARILPNLRTLSLPQCRTIDGVPVPDMVKVFAPPAAAASQGCSGGRAAE